MPSQVKVSDDGNVILVVADKHEVDLLPDIDFEKLRLVGSVEKCLHRDMVAVFLLLTHQAGVVRPGRVYF